MSAVATQTGEDMRQRALGILSHRYKLLAARSTTFAFSSIEQTELAATGRALDELTSMAPTGPLIPTHAKDWFNTGL